MIMHRYTLWIGGVVLAGLLLSLASFRLTHDHRPPNVLFILTDDQGWGDLSLHGNPYVKTPHLDQLARDGARFERFFVSPLCAPTRASLLTGRYHLRTGTVSVTGGWERMNADEQTLAEVFRQNGYATGCFGKWHNGEHYPEDPNGQGFDEFLGFCAGHWNNYFDTELQHNDQMVPTHGFITDVLTEAAIGFIEKKRNKPFFCYLPYNAPHSPFQVPDRYFAKYKAMGLDDHNACVYGMVENMDDNIGRLLARLRQLNLIQNTIVVFATDNGPNGPRFNGGMKGIKGQVDEGGVRVPLFVRWPGHIQPGTVIRPIAAHVDLLPTLTELCGLPAGNSKPLDGRSWAAALRGDAADVAPDRRLFTHVAASVHGTLRAEPGAVRTAQYRLVLQNGQARLFNLTADPGQVADIAAREPQQVSNLRRDYDRWFADVSAALTADRPIPVAARRVLLQAPEARFVGDVRYKQGNGWANDYFTHWQSTQDSISWTVTVDRPRRYGVYLQHTCPARSRGAVVRVSVAGQTIQQSLRQAFDPPDRTGPDRVPRKEVYEKRWALLKLGTVRLPQGPQQLVLRASLIPLGTVADVKGILLREE